MPEILENCKKTTLELEIDLNEKTLAEEVNKKTNAVRLLINYDLLYTDKPNKNGEMFDYETTKSKAGTIEGGYINFAHRTDMNIGTVLSSEFIDLEGSESGKINCTGLIWRDVLYDYGISEEDFRNGNLKISMEVYYNDYEFDVGGQRVASKVYGDYNLDEMIGQEINGKLVSKVIIPYIFSGNAATFTPAETRAIIHAVANHKNKEGNDNMFKEFETEEQFNEFKTSLAEEMKEEIRSELTVDEDFLNEIRNGYVSVAEVLDKFKDVELEGEDLEGVVKSVAEIKENFETINNEYEEFKKTVAEEKLLKKRVAELEQFGYELEDGEDKEIVAMSDEAFNMVKKTAKKAFDKATAEINNDNKEEGFNPNNVNLNDDSELDIVKTFIN